jgi:hypothetical protein
MSDPKNMTRYEAMKAVQNGYKIGHRFFTPEESVKRDEKSRYNQLIDESGVPVQFSEFFGLRVGGACENGWFIVQEVKEM